MTAPPGDVRDGRFIIDLLADVLTDASAAQWRRRADTFRAARPRAGDFTGRATVDARRDQWRRLTQTATACDARAEVLGRYRQDWHEVFDVLAEPLVAA